MIPEGVWGAKVGALVGLYWSENLILGAYTLVKMVAHAPVQGLLSGAFFFIHHGGFCAVHGIFVLALAVGDEGFDFLEGDTWPLPLLLLLVMLKLGLDVVLHRREHRAAAGAH